MNENEVIKNIDKKTVEEAIEFILAEGRCEGYQEAMKVYGKQYADIIRKGRRQGFVIAGIVALAGIIAYKLGKKKLEEKIKGLKEKKEPINVDEKDITFEDFKEE